MDLIDPQHGPARKHQLRAQAAGASAMGRDCGGPAALAGTRQQRLHLHKRGGRPAAPRPPPRGHGAIPHSPPAAKLRHGKAAALKLTQQQRDALDRELYTPRVKPSIDQKRTQKARVLGLAP